MLVRLSTRSTPVERGQTVGYARDLGQRVDGEQVGRAHADHGDVVAAELSPHLGVVLHGGVVARQDALDRPLDAHVPGRQTEQYRQSDVGKDDRVRIANEQLSRIAHRC